MHFPLSGFERKSAEFLGYCANKKGYMLFWSSVFVFVIALCYLVY